MTYDYITPEYNEKTADYAAPTYPVGDRNRDGNIESTVKWWLDKKISGWSNIFIYYSILSFLVNFTHIHWNNINLLSDVYSTRRIEITDRHSDIRQNVEINERQR